MEDRNELSRQTEMFEELIGKATPALRTRSSALLRRYLEQEGQYGGLMAPQISTEDFNERGLVLVDRYESIQDPNPNLMTLGGTCLVLLTDGTLAELRRSGSRSCGDEEWSATLRHLSPRDAVVQYGFASCVKKLTAALDGER